MAAAARTVTRVVPATAPSRVMAAVAIAADLPVSALVAAGAVRVAGVMTTTAGVVAAVPVAADLVVVAVA